MSAPASDPDRSGSPADAYSRFRASQSTPELTAFADGYGFVFDDYQREACAHLEAGAGVLVAAPTGAGKTIVGEFAVYLALQRGQKCFYTTPIKALSNQKYADLVRRHGADRVGLLTGDSSINSEAPVVVMTTEVLRNMLYAGSRTLENLAFVVMDEVHYLADRFRGAVWEEVIIGLAESISVVALSATVSNAEEFGDWLGEVRGELAVVVSERRPVPLFQHALVGRKLYDLFEGDAPTAIALPGSTKAEVNPALIQVAKAETRYVRDDSRRPRGRGGRGKRQVSYGSGQYGGASHRSRWEGQGGADDRGARPRSLGFVSRPDLIETLDAAALLPAIVFIFSRVGCDAAVQQVASSAVRLTSAEEAEQITAIAERHVAGLSAADLRALDYSGFLDALTRGVAAHHAGLLPAFKECVEETFVRGLTKVVFATETLALGINMPARSVVLEKLVKFNGETHADITPGEFTQLTGRAGRRGIDVEGHAVVLWQPGLDPRAVAGLASRRTYPLRSSFAPTYNMAVNLVGRVGKDRARTLLEQSFAQFQSDRSVVGTARSLARNTEAIADNWAAAECERGDYQEYARLRARIGALESQAARDRRSDRRAEALQRLLDLRPGDIVRVPAGKHTGWSVVIDPDARAADRDNPRPLVLTEDRQVRRLSVVDFPVPPQVAGRMRVPKHFHPKDAAARRSLGAALRSKLADLDDGPRIRPAAADAELTAEVQRLREDLARHPCHGCPDRERHARRAEKALLLERENERAQQRMGSRTNTIATQFDRICLVLSSLGYLAADEDGHDVVTDAGRMLSRIYAELDLVATECVRDGTFDDLTPPQLVAVLAAFVYEARRSDDGHRKPRMPDGVTEAVMTHVRRRHREVSLVERDARLPRGTELDIGFSAAAFAWAAGQPLALVLTDSGLTAGDFVRWVRQVIDFTGQIGDAAGPGPVRDVARDAVHRMRRGVVGYASDERR